MLTRLGRSDVMRSTVYSEFHAQRITTNRVYERRHHSPWRRSMMGSPSGGCRGRLRVVTFTGPNTDESPERKRRVGRFRAGASGSDKYGESPHVRSARASAPSTLIDDRCPHAQGDRCHVRDRRPLGCRIFYCDPKAQAWQGPLMEDQLARLHATHDELDVPYFYADRVLVLRALQHLKWAGKMAPLLDM